MVNEDESLSLIRKMLDTRDVVCNQEEIAVIHAGRLVVGAILFAFGAGAAWSETAFEWKKMGDWRAIENAWKYSDELTGQEEVHWASTRALEGRAAVLGIAQCSRYQIMFSFESDAEFNGPNPEAERDEYLDRIAHGKVLPSENMMPVRIWSAYADYFFYNVDDMIPAQKFLICPTREEGPRCLTFSLRGFAAALKAVCPKR
jgi:hypothetical protein